MLESNNSAVHLNEIGSGSLGSDSFRLAGQWIQWPMSCALHDAALLVLLSEVMNQAFLTAQRNFCIHISESQSERDGSTKMSLFSKTLQLHWKLLSHSEKSHCREMRCSKNSAAGWLGMLILKTYLVFIRKEPKDLITWGQCLYLIQHETSVLLSLIWGRDVETCLMRKSLDQRTSWTARWPVEWFRGGWAHWGMICPT